MNTTQPHTATRAELLDIWRRCITNGRTIDPYAAVVQELAAFYKLPEDEVRRRCEHWEEESVAQWHAQDRSSADSVVEFFQTQTSWVFDTMRYHAEQCKGEAFPESVEVMHGLGRLRPGKHLDFGCGPGSSSLFFHALGWDVTLADISTTFLDFARWRLAQRQIPAQFIDTSTQMLPSNAYDLVTAFDVIVHIPDAGAAISDVHRALKPGGTFVFNIDSRPRGPTTEYHFFEAHYPILRQVRARGFRRRKGIAFFYVFEKVEHTPMQRALVTVLDTLRYNAVTHKIGQVLRRVRGR